MTRTRGWAGKVGIQRARALQAPGGWLGGHWGNVSIFSDLPLTYAKGE